MFARCRGPTVHKVRQKLADTPHQERLRTSRASKVQSEIHACALGSSATSASPRARLAMLSKRCDCAICPPCGGPADRSADCSIPHHTEVGAVPTPLPVLPKMNFSDSALAHLTSGPENLREPLCYFPHLRVLRLNTPPKVNPTPWVLQVQPVVGPSGPNGQRTYLVVQLQAKTRAYVCATQWVIRLCL